MTCHPSSSVDQLLCHPLTWRASAKLTSLRLGLNVRDCLRISGFWISEFCPARSTELRQLSVNIPQRFSQEPNISNNKCDHCKNKISEQHPDSRDMGAKHSKRRGLSKDDLEYLLGKVFSSSTKKGIWADDMQMIRFLGHRSFSYNTNKGLNFSENTNYSIETIMAWYRGFKEDCPDGRLTPKAFMHVYGSSFLSANTKEFCDYVFRNFDKDGNGYIDFKEFLLAIHVTSCGSPEDKLGWAFRWDFGLLSIIKSQILNHKQ